MIQTQNDLFILSGKSYTYAFGVYEGKLRHLYFGAPIDNIAPPVPVYPPNARLEIGEYGRGDFRTPFLAVHGDGCMSTELRYTGYKIIEKPALGMPALRGTPKTLVITLTDELLSIRLRLYYTPYEEALVRRAELENFGAAPLQLDKLMSVGLDLPSGEYEAVTLPGKWGGERQVSRDNIQKGIRSISSTKGNSSHDFNPFAAIVKHDTTERYGEAIGFNLIYSGNFLLEFERGENDLLRVNLGLGLAHGDFTVAAGESISSPEAVLVYSDEGLGEMSRKFHRLYRGHLINPRFVDLPRPIVINSWESTYFDFDEKKILDFIEGAKGLGIDTVVLDDGWFGHRDRDDSSLGDWHVDRHKLPNGLTPLIQACKKNNMKFGIWFEPEAISPDSDLYRAHPDWAIGTEGREGIQMRNEFLLDFSRKEVVDEIFAQMCAILENNDIAYVKWDMNRNQSDVPNARLSYDYIRGVYSLYERLTKKFPDLLIEGCAGGGARFDPGILYYSPMIWTSDNTDAYCRARIQYGTSLCYPLQTMSNHVSVCPNHQTGRTISFATRGNVASLGCLGYELNLSKATKEERALVKEQTAAYRKDAQVILKGNLYRLLDPFTDNLFCEMVVSEDRTKAYLVHMVFLRRLDGLDRRVRLEGLTEDWLYKIEETGEIATGRTLMNRGIDLPTGANDFTSLVYHITKADAR